MASNSENFKNTVSDWSAIYGRQLSDEEVRQINDNLFQVFTILRKWDSNNKEIKKDKEFKN